MSPGGITKSHCPVDMEEIKIQTAYEISFQAHVKNIIHRQWVPFTEMTLELESEYKGIVTQKRMLVQICHRYEVFAVL